MIVIVVIVRQSRITVDNQIQMVKARLHYHARASANRHDHFQRITDTAHFHARAAFHGALPGVWQSHVKSFCVLPRLCAAQRRVRRERDDRALRGAACIDAGDVDGHISAVLRERRDKRRERNCPEKK